MNIDSSGSLHTTRGIPGAGQFAGRSNSQPSADLPMTGAGSFYPAYPTSGSVDGHATVVDEGQNQICECGNSTYADDWAAADSAGRLNADSAGSSDPAEFTVCPACRRVYANEALFEADQTPALAIARYDTRAAEFIAARGSCNRAAYSEEPHHACSQHGGARGADDTCGNGTDCSGLPRTWPFPRLPDGLRTHEVDVHLTRDSGGSWRVEAHPLNGLATDAEVTHADAEIGPPRHGLRSVVGDDAWWPLSGAPAWVREQITPRLAATSGAA